VLPDEIRKALSLPAGATHGDAIALAQARQAIKGKTEAAREIREAIEGKTAQRGESEDASNRIRVLVINGDHRPNRDEIQKNQKVINVPGLTKP
jgi:hypothetical protein